jgi:hypothetical protein
MRLHSNTLTVRDIETALQQCKHDGTVDGFVQFETFDVRKSQSRNSGFEIQLGWYGTKQPGDGRRWKNTGNRGANSEGNAYGVYAATYDEWGYFIAELFRLDSDLTFGHYKSLEVFNSMTKNQYT